jgi:hypothetical protein
MNHTPVAREACRAGTRPGISVRQRLALVDSVQMQHVYTTGMRIGTYTQPQVLRQ